MNRAGIGDSHRFGRNVRRCDQSGAFLKPRSGHLEFLFFDRTSPLAPWLQRLLPNRFYFEVSCLSDWEARVEDLSNRLAQTSTSLNETNSENDYAESFAHWSTLALLFGFNDLHCGNCLIVSHQGRTVFQPIDLELIFEPVTNLVDTGLLNHPRLPVDRAGLLGQWGDTEAKKKYFRFPVKKTVDSLIHQFQAAEADLSQTVDILWQENLNRPLRRIPKLTDTYRAALAASKPLPVEFAPEERAQLHHGDIPYFFSLHPAVELNYFYTPDLIAIVNSNLGLSPKLEVADLKSPARREKLLKIACLQLLRRFWPESVENMAGDNFSAVNSNGTIKLTTSNFQIATKI